MDPRGHEQYKMQLVETKQAQLDFLNSEIKTALILLEVAETDLNTENLEHSRVALQKAETAYSAALNYFVRFRERHPECVELLEKPMEALEGKLAKLRSRLRQAG